jgi:hypothetical protein
MIGFVKSWFFGVVCIIVQVFFSSPEVGHAMELEARGPIKVITSGPNEPLTYAPIEETACKIVDHLPGHYEYHLCAGEDGNSVPTCKFLSLIEVVRLKGHDDVFLVIEKSIPGTSNGHLTPFHYVQLWNHSGCTLIFADENLAPTWKGANTYMSDSNTTILAFHGGSIGLLKKIQNFPNSSP